MTMQQVFEFVRVSSPYVLALSLTASALMVGFVVYDKWRNP